MIVTEFYHGQGLGNQLWSYVANRVLGLRAQRQFGYAGIQKFKGQQFLNLDFGTPVTGGSSPEGGPPTKLPHGIQHYFVEKELWYPKFSCDVRGFDTRLLHLPDNVKIEGYFQSEELIKPYRDEIRDWLRVRPEFDNHEYSAPDICILNVRGGEYRGNSELLLEDAYWKNAMDHMRRINANMRFVVVTDDVPYAQELFPNLEVSHKSIGSDFSIIKNAHYLILSNSSFAFFPAWINTKLKLAIAPKYWARHNVSDGFWACEFNIYDDWKWQDRSGRLFTAEECRAEYEVYKQKHQLFKLKPRPRKSVWVILYERSTSKLRQVRNRLRKLIRSS